MERRSVRGELLARLRRSSSRPDDGAHPLASRLRDESDGSPTPSTSGDEGDLSGVGGELAAFGRHVIDGRTDDGWTAFAETLRRIESRQGGEVAATFLEACAARLPDDARRPALLVRGLVDIGHTDAARRIATQALVRFPTARWLRIVAIRLLTQAGQTNTAQALLDGRRAYDDDEEEAPADESARLDAWISGAILEAPPAPEAPVVSAAMVLVALAATRRPGRMPLAPARHALGPVTLVTGTLGAGGAERQFVNTAVGLHTAAEEGRSIAGHPILGPIRPFVRTLDADRRYDFFLPALTGVGLEVASMRGLRDWSGAPPHTTAADLVELVERLPKRMREGVARLTDQFRVTMPDVVHLWQDGMILMGALPALLAGVPRIVLGLRTVPPIDRPERHSDAYELLCRNLLAMPHVSAVTNARYVAERYAAWLDLDPGIFTVVANGVQPSTPHPTTESELMWARFDARCPARFTLGCVMRLDANKRPLLWLDIAASLLARDPDVRFVIVGEGALAEAAAEYARDLGIADRVLFVGRSENVGYWLSRMDALLLVSRHEGVPNALIEAQLAGVPVVTTPAGGAAEAVDADRTGLVLASASTVDPRDVADRMFAQLLDPDRRREFSTRAAVWAQNRFSVASMLDATVEAYMARAPIPRYRR